MVLLELPSRSVENHDAELAASGGVRSGKLPVRKQRANEAPGEIPNSSLIQGAVSKRRNLGITWHFSSPRFRGRPWNGEVGERALNAAFIAQATVRY